MVPRSTTPIWSRHPSREVCHVHRHRNRLRSGRPAGEGPRSPVDALRPPVGDDRGRRRADHRAGRGASHLGCLGQALLRRPLRPVRGERRSRAPAPRRGRGQAGGGARLLPDLVVRASRRDRAGRAAGALRPGRPQPGVLLHRRRRGRRDRVQARQAVLEARRQAGQAQGDLARGRLSRHPAGRARDHRHPRDEGDVRAGHPRWIPGAQHEPLPRRRIGLRVERQGRRARGVRRVGGRPHRAGDPVRRPRHHRRGLPRARAERRRLLPPAARILRRACARSATATTCCSSATR